MEKQLVKEHFMSIDKEKLRQLSVKLNSITQSLTLASINRGEITINRDELNGIVGILEDTRRELDTIIPIIHSETQKPVDHKEMVNHPNHYQGNKLECIDVMVDVFGIDKVKAFCELNAFKYQWRSNSKGTDVQDKAKAIWYLSKYNKLSKDK